MNRPTQQEIDAEIAALKALRTTGRWARKTAATINLQIDTLASGFDETSEEFEELATELQMAVQDTLNWKAGHSTEKPSTGWNGLVS